MPRLLNTFNRPDAKAVASLIFSLGLMFLSVASFAAFSPTPTDAQAKELSVLRQTGLRGDRSQVPALVAGLKNPSHRFYKFTALHSLAQLGAEEALPNIANVLDGAQSSNIPDSGVARFATAAKARLLAESEARDIADGKARTAAKISRFLNEIGLSVADINAAAAEYHKRGGEVQTRQEPPLAVYALREIADILYQAPAVDDADLALVSPLDFADDPPSALKMRLVQIPRPDRLNVLVQELAHGKVSYEVDNYEMQLVADEGPAAGRAIATQLEEMDAHRKQYTSGGFTTLFRTLAGVGDKDQAPLIERFLHEPDGFMKYFAEQVAPDVELGNIRLYAPGY